MTVPELVSKFVSDLSDLIVASLYPVQFTSQEVKEAIGGLKRAHVPPVGGSYTGFVHPSNLTATGKVRTRKKVLCPIRRCQNVAAPIFGMVCKKHKDVPKSVVNEQRKARKARDAKVSK